MNIKETFAKSLSSPPRLPAGKTAEDFLGHIYSSQSTDDNPLFRLLSGGSIKALSPYSFDIRSLDCYMLLYTKKGCGKLLIGNHVSTLVHPSLLFLDCHERFRLDIAIEPWEYDVFFITGRDLSYYYNLLPERGPALMPLLPYSEAALCMKHLTSLTGIGTLHAELTVSQLIHTVVIECIRHQLSETPPPSDIFSTYLTDIKDLFDNAFQEDYSLDELEERFHISKYRLCREFGAAFGMTPLQYLNKRRIDMAKHLLLTTNLKVHEVGSSVGIDNTNHFINLFKKFAETTPLEYKQRMTR